MVTPLSVTAKRTVTRRYALANFLRALWLPEKADVSALEVRGEERAADGQRWTERVVVIQTVEFDQEGG